jgi:hypothetical protein
MTMNNAEEFAEMWGEGARVQRVQRAHATIATVAISGARVRKPLQFIY